MVSVRSPRTLRTIPFLMAVCLLGLPVYAKYSGGTGEPNDPYQIATAADLIALGNEPSDYGKHFVLTADIDLDPNLPGRKVFDKAVIAPDTNDATSWFEGTPFTGVFDGNGHTVSYLTIKGASYLGLFGRLGGVWNAPAVEVRNLAMMDVNIAGSGDCVGALVGENEDCSTVTSCYSTGVVTGADFVGGLVGCSWSASLIQSCSAADVSGSRTVGGLIGWHGDCGWGDVTQCHSTGTVQGNDQVGGLIGYNQGTVTQCHSTGAVRGTNDSVGGLVGHNGGPVAQCYSTSQVSGTNLIGGLVGTNYHGEADGGALAQCYSTGSVDGNEAVGGLVGKVEGGEIQDFSPMWVKGGAISDCYSMGRVSGRHDVGGLVGTMCPAVVSIPLLVPHELSYTWPSIDRCYSTGVVTGQNSIGGLVGYNDRLYGRRYGGRIEAEVIECFWDSQASGQTTSDGGTGKSTAEMQTAKTFLDAGWDFVGETVNGTEDIWKIAEGLDYPRFWWEPYDGRVTVVLGRIFTVTLESNPSTGYRWEWVDHQDSIVEQIGQAQFKPRETGDPPLVGAGGWESFDFKAVNQGQMTLKLVYRRPWEEGVEPLKTFSLQVTVP